MHARLGADDGLADICVIASSQVTLQMPATLPIHAQMHAWLRAGGLAVGAGALHLLHCSEGTGKVPQQATLLLPKGSGGLEHKHADSLQAEEGMPQ